MSRSTQQADVDFMHNIYHTPCRLSSSPSSFNSALPSTSSFNCALTTTSIIQQSIHWPTPLSIVLVTLVMISPELVLSQGKQLCFIAEWFCVDCRFVVRQGSGLLTWLLRHSNNNSNNSDGNNGNTGNNCLV